MPAGADRNQQQQTQVRLGRHNTEQNTSQDRAARKLQQSPSKQTYGQEEGLAMRWSKHGRKGQADPERQRPPPQDSQIPGEPIANQAAERPRLFDLATAVQLWKPTTCFGPFRCAAFA
jgi:hypothetical protein